MIVKGFRGMFTGLRGVAICLYFFATILTCINAVSRYVFNYVIFGSEELCTYTILILSFLVFPIIEAEGLHLKIDVFNSLVKSEKVKEVVRVIQGFVTMGICGIIAYYGWQVTRVAHMYASASPTLKIPKDIVFGITTASFVIAILGWICVIFINRRRHL